MASIIFIGQVLPTFKGRKLHKVIGNHLRLLLTTGTLRTIGKYEKISPQNYKEYNVVKLSTELEINTKDNEVI